VSISKYTVNIIYKRAQWSAKAESEASDSHLLCDKAFSVCVVDKQGIPGLFAPKNFRSQERTFSRAKVPWNFRGTFTPGYIRSRERKFQGAIKR